LVLDWRYVSSKEVINHHGAALLNKIGGLYQLIEKYIGVKPLFPENQYRGLSKAQLRLFKLFKRFDIIIFFK
jgi:hypothetical protein